MLRHLLLLSLLLASTAFAEEKCLVQQFSLADGRTVQAVRLIKIETVKKTSYLITLADGTKMSLDGDDVLKISEVYIPISEAPPSLNVIKKPEPVVVAAKPKEESPAEVPNDIPPPYSQAPDYYVQYFDNVPRRHHTPSPPPQASAPAPQRQLTASEHARQAFSTVPSFQTRK